MLVTLGQSVLMDISVTDGFETHQRQVAAEMFWQAFKGKLHRIMNPEARALAFFTSVVDAGYAISAQNEDGTLVGVAGFKTADGAFVAGGLKELCTAYGWVGGTWRGIALSLLERSVQPDTLLMDGIFVHETARGFGVGTKLLNAIKEKAEALKCSKIRLDVIDTNPRARALYERQGFVAGETTGTGPLRHLFGFNSSTEMVYSH